MKTKKISSKLILNKERISELTNAALKSVRGGATEYVSCVALCNKNTGYEISICGAASCSPTVTC